LRKDKSEFPIEIGLNPVVTVDGTLVLASIIDITERKKAEERFRLVVESAPNAMVLVNHEGVITLVNNQTEKLFGYERKELIDQKIEMLIPNRFHSHHPEHRDGFFQKPKTRSMGAGRDLFALRKDGTEVQVEIGLNPIETAEGHMVLASIIDITERKIQEESIKKQLALEIKNKELEQFAYIASHDLQEPLRTVSNYMQLFEEEYAGILDNNAIKFIHSVNNATKRMSLLIKSLLEFSKLGNNRKLSRVNCNALINEVIEDLETTIKNTGSIIEVSEMPTLDVYEIEIRQLFQNLISNAIKFRKNNVAPKISIEATLLEDLWTFKISDNGIGIAPIHFNRIFDIFQRLHISDEYEGNGIGLANCKKIVQMHGGEIWLESTPSIGTTFFFTIPNLSI
jgi:PAS domain S-box-containing protein